MNPNFETSPCMAWGRTGVSGAGMYTINGRREGPLRRYLEHLSSQANLASDERTKERARIARESHDTVKQSFLGVSLQLQEEVEQTPPDSASKPFLIRALKVLNRAIDEGRLVLQGLPSSASPRTSLESALYDLREELVFNCGVQYRVFVTGDPTTLNPELQQQIYFIAREAVTNALRHSQATAIEVELEYLRRRLRVVVRDNGVGIDPQVMRPGRRSHWGLLGMHERAESIGAQLKIWSRRGAGTDIDICVPMDLGRNTEMKNGNQPLIGAKERATQ